MQDPANELLRIPLPRTPVNRGEMGPMHISAHDTPLATMIIAEDSARSYMTPLQRFGPGFREGTLAKAPRDLKASTHSGE